MEKQKKWDNTSIGSIVVFSIGIFIIFFGLALKKAGVIADSDEALFHYPNVLNFSDNGIAATFNNKYSAANTPLPYIIVAVLGKLFTPSLLLARIVTCIFSIFSFYFICRIIKLSGAPVYYALVIFFYPYFFNNSFVFYVTNYGLFFVLWAVYILKKKETNLSYIFHFLVGMLLCLGILCQQFYLVIPFSIILYNFALLMRNKSALNTGAVWKFATSSFFMLLPMVLPIALFIKWGGLTHPNFNIHSLSFYPSTLVAILFVTGFYLFIFLLQEYKRLGWKDLLMAALLTLGLVTFFRPEFSNTQGPGLFTGIAFHDITLTGKISDLLPIITMGLACFAGILIFMAFFKTASLKGWNLLMLIIIGLLALGYATNTQIGERHLLGFFILLLLLILPAFKKPFISWQLVWMGFMGIGYFFYWTFFKYN
jgi:hypothetical protein